MSVTDPADPVQPEGQGGAGSDSPYGEYLSRIPEEARGAAEEAFKAWDANTTRRFQEASEYKQNWEPYEQIGVNQHDPDTVQWGIQMAQAARENPQAVVDWAREFAQQNGLTLAEAAQQAQQQQQQFDEYGQPVQEQPNLESLLQQQLAPIQQKLTAFEQWQQQQQEQAAQDAAQHALDQRMQELSDQHGEAFNKDWVERLSWKYATPGADPRKVVDQAFADYQTLTNQIERSTLQGKVDAPAPPEGGGGVANAASEPLGFKDVGSHAIEMIREMNRSQ